MKLRGNVVDLYGKKFGKLTVVSFYEKSRTGKFRWRCICDCGNETIVQGSNLKSGCISSCGCYNKEQASIRLTSHQMTNTCTYITWSNMIQRCTNPKNIGYKNYGGRGIKVCDRWMKFENFLSDMGEKPKDLSIERIDVNGNYELINCCWATIEQQSTNKRNVWQIKFNWMKYSLTRFCKEFDLKYEVVRQKLVFGMSIEDASGIKDSYVV